MLSALFIVSMSATCSYIVDLSHSSGHGSETILKGFNYCLRFSSNRGVFVMNNIGDASAETYYSSSFGVDISNCTSGNDMYESSSKKASNSIVSFGPYYGTVSVYARSTTVVYYSYFYANSTCKYVSISTKSSAHYDFSSSKICFNSGDNYCFAFSAYNLQSVSIARDASTSSDVVLYQHGNENVSSVSIGSNSFSNSDPFIFIYSANSSGCGKGLNSVVTASDKNNEVSIESSIADLNSITYISSTETEDSLSKLVIIVISVVGACILGVSMYFVWRYYGKNKIYDFFHKRSNQVQKAINSSDDGAPSTAATPAAQADTIENWNSEL